MAQVFLKKSCPASRDGTAGPVACGVRGAGGAASLEKTKEAAKKAGDSLKKLFGGDKP